MTVSGGWSRYRKARPPKAVRLGRWQQVLADALDQNLAIGVRQRSLIISAEPRPGPNSMLLDEPPKSRRPRSRPHTARAGGAVRYGSAWLPFLIGLDDFRSRVATLRGLAREGRCP